MTKAMTAIFMGIIMLVVLAWDVIVAIEPTPRDTVSKVFLDLSKSNMALPLAAGALMGHLTWAEKMSCSEFAYWRVSLPVLALAVIASVALDRLAHVHISPSIAFLLGYVLGHLLWPQAE